jgi:PAS domain-containing protein
MRAFSPTASGDRRPRWLALATLLAACGSGCVTEPEPTPEVCALPAARARRLSASELQHSLQDLFVDVDLGDVALPPDPRPAEFDNNVDALQPSALWVEALHVLARRGAEQVLQRADVVVGCDPGEAACSTAYVEHLAGRAFRRALDDDELADLQSFFNEEPGLSDPRAGLTLAVEYVLQSPGFLYRVDRATDDGHVDATSLASRLSYFLWGTMPDDELRTAAIEGRLDSKADIDAQVNRLLDDERAKDAVLHIASQWLDFERLDRTVKTEADGFTAELRAGFALEQEMLIKETLFAQNNDVTTLLNTTEAYVNDAVAELYGVSPSVDGSAIQLPPERGGLLRRGGFLASHAHPTHPSPVQRGVFVLDRLLCTELGPPPAGADVTPPVPGEAGAQTNRQVVESRTSGGSCIGCHSLINPLGFALETFDTVGRLRSDDFGLPIDDSGRVFGAEVQGAQGLVDELTTDKRVQRCAVRKLLVSAWGTLDADQGCLVDDIIKTSRSTGLRDLLFAIATHDSFRAATSASVTP